jgi:hypothetical protein
MTRNIEMLEIVAAGLGELLDEVVFVGGATVTLYVTDPAAPEARPTNDVDLVFEISTLLEYGRLEERLRATGFTHDTSQGAPLCRWICRGVTVDAMPTDPAILGFANQWYRDALAQSTLHALPSGRAVHILTPPYFLATKLEAFHARGSTDIRLSSDLEDVVYLLDNRQGLTREVTMADPEVKGFIRTAMGDLLRNPSLPEAIEAALGFGTARERAQAVLSIIRTLARSA